MRNFVFYPSVNKPLLSLCTLLCFSSFIHWGCKSPKSKLDSAVADEIRKIQESSNSDETNMGYIYKSNIYQQNLTAPYQKTPDKIWTLKHTDLDLSLNWNNRTVHGQAALILQNQFHSQLNSVELNAQGMDITAIKIDTSLNQLNPNFKEFNLLIPAQSVNANWSYNDSAILKIQLPYSIKRNQSIRLFITYTANPERKVYNKPTTAGAAISADKGAYFINNDLTHPVYPRQFWTQGETHASSRWFPTIDHPSQKHTQTLRITYPDTMISISNGRLSSSKTIPQNKEKTDWWTMDQPHSVYLTMLGVGNWKKTESESAANQSGKVPVSSYVEPVFEKAANDHFKNTSEMIEFFGKYTGVSYPWGKFDQVCVREFVSGAMENTSCVVHNERLMDAENDMEDYVSHELFHHWFGDLATCENWSDLTLNESFATYGEYLWREHKYGVANAQNWMKSNSQISESAHFKALVNHYYNNPDEQFDDVRYNKGAAILHMLRNYIGDENFQSSLKLYLSRFAYKSTNVHDWKKVVEEVSGRNMDDFFNSWYFAGGKLSIDYYIGRDTTNTQQKGYRLYIHSYANMSSYSSDAETANSPKLTPYYGSNKAVALPIRWGTINANTSTGTQYFTKDTTIYTQADQINYSIYLGETLPDFVLLDPNTTLLSDDIQPNYPMTFEHRLEERKSLTNKHSDIWNPELLFQLGYNAMHIAPESYLVKNLPIFFGGYLYVATRFWPANNTDSVALQFGQKMGFGTDISQGVQTKLIQKLIEYNHSLNYKYLREWSIQQWIAFAFNLEIFSEIELSEEAAKLRKTAIADIESTINDKSAEKSIYLSSLISGVLISPSLEENPTTSAESKTPSNGGLNKDILNPKSSFMEIDWKKDYSLIQLDSLRRSWKDQSLDMYLHFYSNRNNCKQTGTVETRNSDSLLMDFAKKQLTPFIRSNEVDVLLPIQDRHLLSRNVKFLFEIYNRTYHKLKVTNKLTQEYIDFEKELWEKFFLMPLIGDHRNEILSQLFESLSESVEDELFSALEFQERLQKSDAFAITGGALYNLNLNECYEKLELLKTLSNNELTINNNPSPKKFMDYHLGKLKMVSKNTEAKSSNRLALMKLNEFLK